jgi:hypothetical protein
MDYESPILPPPKSTVLKYGHLDNYFVKKKIPLKYKTLLDRGKS